MEWIYLLLAGVLEIGWPLGLKLSQTTENKYTWIIFSAVCMIASGVMLYLAQRNIPMGTAYAIWTGIGAAGAFIIGIIIFKEPASAFRVISVSLIVMGIIGLKLSNN
ncbi:MAG: multidrug efflux SMR transporter [Bacteroidota bacterium]|nr:multidrug efflux SMR transporter [Bacteroidota bacterium]